MKHFFSILFFIVTVNLFSQGKVTGKVIDKSTRKPISDVSILVAGTKIGSVTDVKGEFKIENVPLGYVQLQASYLGYQLETSGDYLVTKEKVPYVVFELVEEEASLNEIVIQQKLFKKSITSPLSVQSLRVAEIEKNPGGSRDVLKVLQSLPGVASNPGFRNDIIIRGGATSENKFYLDGVEVPVINHFQTQGASGGPVGIINVDLIQKVDFYTSAFPINTGNALSSVISFSQKSGNLEALRSRVTIGTSDAGITLDGPLGKQTSFMFSARQSYLQFLFKLIQLPFLPTYNDVQFKVNTTFSDNSQLSVIGLGALDNFRLNEAVNDGITDLDVLKRNTYVLNNIPIQKQWNYVVGATYKTYTDNAMHQFVISRNQWQNSIEKYFNNTNKADDLLLDYTSTEIENKFRYDYNFYGNNGLKLSLGTGVENGNYTNTTFQKIVNSSGTGLYDFSSDLQLIKTALFGQISKKYWQSKLALSLGVRMDASTYNSHMNNPLHQFSPRFSLSYLFHDNWSFNSSVGNYHQLPSYTILGFRNSSSELVNKSALKYIEAKHFVSGFEFRPDNSIKVTLEGFYKQYDNYPFSIRNQISLANLGADFGVVGSEAVTSTSEGRAYGIELLVQKKSYKGVYGILSYTYVNSEFKDKNDVFIPSTWDNKHLLSLTAGKKLYKGWEIGGKFRLVGGRPYTPYDIDASSIIENYNVSNEGILNYQKINSQRFGTYTQLDVRLDKTWFWKRFSLNCYLDVQNLLKSKVEQQNLLLPKTDLEGNRLIDPIDNSKYVLEEINNTDGNVFPSIGFIVDF